LAGRLLVEASGGFSTPFAVFAVAFAGCGLLSALLPVGGSEQAQTETKP
jgi:hypothetical protein